MTFMKNYLWYYKSKRLYFQDFPISYSKAFVEVLILAKEK